MKNLIQKIGRLFSRKSESDELEIFLRSNTEMNLFKREDEVDIRKKEDLKTLYDKVAAVYKSMKNK